MTIGSQIALLRKQKSMTQEMLANKLGVSNQAVSKWEAEQCCPDIQLLPQIADIFEVSLDNLFGREVSVQKEAVCGDLPWEDDNTLRLVLFLGHTLQKIQDCKELQDIEFVYHGNLLNVDSCISVRCENVMGNINAGVNVECGDVEGTVNAGVNACCGDVEGNANAGVSVSCGDVGGNVDAGVSVSCGDIDGDVDAGGNVNCGDIDGDVDAGGYVECGDIGGNVDAGQYVKSETNS